MARRLQERFRFDQDDDPTVAPEGAEEQDRMLVDEYDPRYLRHMMTLLTEQDQQLMNNDATVLQDGCLHVLTPFRIAATLLVRKDAERPTRIYKWHLASCNLPTNAYQRTATLHPERHADIHAGTHEGHATSHHHSSYADIWWEYSPSCDIKFGSCATPSSIIPSASKCRLLTDSRVQRVAYPPLVYGQRCSESFVYTEWCTCHQWTDL